MDPIESAFLVDIHRIGQPAEIHAHLVQESIGIAGRRECAKLDVDSARLRADGGRRGRRNCHRRRDRYWRGNRRGFRRSIRRHRSRRIFAGDDRFYVDQATAAPEQAQALRGGVGEVDQPVFVKRPAIVHAHDNRFARGDIRHARVARQGQQRVRRAHRVHVVYLAGGGFLPVIALAVPTRHAARLVGREPGIRRVGVAEHRIRPAGEFVDRFDFRRRFGNRIQVHRRIGARAVVEIIAAGFRRCGARRGAATAGERDCGQRRNQEDRVLRTED